MALHTREAIRESFLELLNERPMDKILVRDIAQRSEISRNTFYYYYRDIYALTEDIFEMEIEKVSAKTARYDSWKRAFLDATEFARSHRMLIFHIYGSADRSLLERYFRRTILTAILSYVRREAEGLKVPEHKLTALAQFYAAALVGLTENWISTGMGGEPEAFLDDLEDMLDGNIRRALEHAEERQ